MPHGYTVSIGKLGNLKIDLIAEKPNEKILILHTSFCYLMPNKEVIQRETTPLLEVEDNPTPKEVILSMDEVT